MYSKHDNDYVIHPDLHLCTSFYLSYAVIFALKIQHVKDNKWPDKL